MNYKSTLNLPQTEFPMKAELPKREPGFLEKWNQGDIYRRLLEKNKGRPKFILHDGPPYANGHIHFGHILNKILKDIVVKYKNMTGFESPFVPGWDCHGLPIELGAIKELAAKDEGASKGAADPLIRRQACRDYAWTYINAQREQFKRLGIFGDWDHPYLTLDNKYEANIAREFATLYLKGSVYQGKKPVYWCPSCRTALAEAEVEYEEQTSPSIYVKFSLREPKKLDLPDNKGVYFVIWTTTPWTLPANVALAVGSDFRYEAYPVGDEIYIMARDLKNAFFSAIKSDVNPEPVDGWLGTELVEFNLEADHPFMNRVSRVVLGDHVTLETGTGIVHIAPGHGQEDYEVGLANKLETLCPVDGEGKIILGSLENARYPEVRTWEGLFVKKANKGIIEFLHNKGFLLSDPSLNLTHSYPHCWRCKNPVLFRATEQWFCSLSHGDLRKKALRAINSEVKWIPTWGHDRIFGMIENRPDWCLSRQRIWGVPIIIHFCRSCRTPLLNEPIADHIVSIFEKEGADAWWKTEEALLPAGIQCPQCKGSDFEKEKSILDVWFDSGVSHAAVLEKRDDLQSPADLYLEGSDQHRGWFHSSLLTSIATRGQPPYKTVLTHGFVVDGQGKKYSKSAKNYVPPENIIDKLGVELLRLWVAAEDYRNDIRVSDEIIKVLAEIYRKIRNTCRFLLGNLYDFDPSKHTVPYEKRSDLDLYALSQLAEVIQRVEKAYEKYEFHVVHHSINKYFTVDLSATYMDILKDRLYCDKADGALRRSAQSTMYDILISMIPLMAPILSFTAEEIWQFIPNRKVDSVFLADWPKVNPQWPNRDIEARWERIGSIRDEVLKALEMARQKKEIGHPLDAKVLLTAQGETMAFLKDYESEWTQIFITSQAEIHDHLQGFKVESKTVPSLKVEVVRAEGIKCERCWNYSTYVGKSTAHPALCERCEKAVS